VRIELETARAQDIPVLTLAPAGARGAPVVLWIPGFFSVKEHGLALGYRLARAGFFFAAFDPLHHGERADGALDRAAQGQVYPPETGMDVVLLAFHVIEQCTRDVVALLAHFAADPRVDATRAGVAGVSIGGGAAFHAFACLPGLRAAVPMIGIPAFARRWADLLDECAYSNAAWAAALAAVAAETEAHTAFVRALDPVERLQQAAPRALLVMNCDFDHDQPKHYAIETYRDLLPHYAAAPDALRLAIYPAGHAVTPDMERDAVEWFTTHLG
jgi:dienelactone hydrolase